MDRIKAWWKKRSQTERLMLGVGVPLVAVAALWSTRRSPAGGAPTEVETIVTGPPVLVGPDVDGGGSFDSDAFLDFADAVTEQLNQHVDDTADLIDGSIDEALQERPPWYWNSLTTGDLWQRCYWRYDRGHSISPVIEALFAKRAPIVWENKPATAAADACVSALLVRQGSGGHGT